MVVDYSMKKYTSFRSFRSRGFFREELNTLTPTPRENTRTSKYDCPDCGAKGVRTEYQVRHRYHCDTCTKNTEESGGIHGF